METCSVGFTPAKTRDQSNTYNGEKWYSFVIKYEKKKKKIYHVATSFIKFKTYFSKRANAAILLQ